jgi:hypothetical protein
MVEHELTASINLTHTIVSLLDFEERFTVSTSSHPSSSLRPSGYFYFDTAFLEDNAEIKIGVILMAQLNLLSDWPVRDTLSVSVLQILQHLILLGFEKQTYFGLTNRNFPLSKTLGSASAASTVIGQFFSTLLSILSRPSNEVREREICLQFLCTCLNSPRFSEFIRTKVAQFREPFTACLEYVDEEGGLAMGVRLLMFLNLLLTERPSIDDLRFVKMCLGDVFRFGDKVTALARLKFDELRWHPDGTSREASLIWTRNAGECLMCQNLLLLYLAILAAMLTTETEYMAGTTCEWVLSAGELFLKTLPAVSLREAEEVGGGCLKAMTQLAQSQSQKGFLEFTSNLHQWLLFGVQGALGEDFACRRWEVYHRTF